MACPTCDHTMAGLGDHLFHCERCGTVMNNADPNWPVVYVPKLVIRCRQFHKAFVATYGDAGIHGEWHRHGIAESINTPENRRSTT